MQVSGKCCSFLYGRNGKGRNPAGGISPEVTTSVLKPGTRVLIVGALAVAAGCSSPPPLLQWEYTGGPQAQNVTDLLIDQRSAATLLAAHTNGDVSRSTDQGHTWAAISALPSHPSILTLVQHPELNRQIYAGTSLGAFMTTDGGTVWTPFSIDPTHPTASCAALALDPFDARQMYAGLNGLGLYRSSNGGAQWARCELGAPAERMREAEVLDVRISPVDPNLVYAAISLIGIVKSTDRGKTWTMLTKELAASGTVPTCLALHTRIRDAICFGTGAGDVYRSVNGGANWSPTRQGSGGTGIGSLAGDPSDPDRLFAATGSGIEESRDFGAVWKPLSVDLPHVACAMTLSSTPTGLVMFAFGQGIGVQRSLDGGTTWQAADGGLGGSTVRVLRQGSRSRELLAVVGSAIYVYRPMSSSWVSASDGLAGGRISSLAFDVDSDSLLYAGTERGIFRSGNSGTSWTLMPRTFGPYPVDFFDTHLSIRTRMFTGTPAGLFVSTDRGLTWKPSRPPGEAYALRSFTYCSDNAGIMHAATRDRGIVGSSDAGLSWEANRYGITGADILAITRDLNDNRLMYCWTATGDGYRSTNRGMEWDHYAPPWKPGDAIILCVDREAPHVALALANRRQVFFTSSAGSTWKSLEVEGLPADVETITWSSRESVLYAGTRDHGVYRIVLPVGNAPGGR